MKLQKTIKAKIFGLTKIKEVLLRQEYENFQSFVHGNKDVSLYSATKQQADRFNRKLGRHLKPHKQYPMILRNDCVKVERAKETSWSKWWFKIPTANVHGGIWCPIQIPYSQSELLDLKIRECKLIWKKDHWSVHIVVEKEVPDINVIPQCRTILGVDLGEVRPATAVLIEDGQPSKHIMATKKVRKLRMHYNWLRQRLGQKKALRTIRKIRNIERRKVDANLHRLSKEIVEMAKENDSAIVLGDLHGIRDRAKTRGKRFRAKVSRMPSFRLSNMIEYKAQWRSVPVVYINEAYTSTTCHICHNEGNRQRQGLFVCPTCQTRYNADLNGAINIGLRFWDYMSQNSGALDTPLNSEEELRT